MLLTLHTETVINSAHSLKDYPGNCANLHGHSWLIKAWFKGDSKNLNTIGILVDFGIMKKLKEMFDHKYINELLFDKKQNPVNPTAENLSIIIYNWLKEQVGKRIQVKVRVYESVIDKECYCETGDF
jgi:6-pyruvoyltetrahydropterin/6-carboxytetrahydropterin synthase